MAEHGYFTSSGGDGGYGGLYDLKLHIVRGETELDSVVLNRDDRSAETACGRDLVAGLQLVQHFLPLLLTLLIGPDKHEVENDNNQDEGQEGEITLALRQRLGIVQ